MGNHLKCSFKKEFLQNVTILYVEDEAKIRNEAIEIFDGFFKKVISAFDGEDGLNKFNKYHNEIDIILTDIKMPRMDGIEFLSSIRETNKDIPVLVTSAFNESDILIKLIKLNVANYIMKPMQLNTTFKIISLLMEEKERKKDVKRQENELKQFMSILDSINLVCEINLDGTISYANDLYLLTSGYSLNDLHKIHHKMINSDDNTCKNFEEAQKSISKGHVWSGERRKTTKEGKVYFTFSIILPIFDNNGEIKKYIEFATLTTKYKTEILLLKKQIVTIKSEHFKSNLGNKHNELYYTELAEKSQKIIDNTVEHAQLKLIELDESRKRNKYLEEKLREQEKRFDEFQSSHYEELKSFSSNDL